ncbi:MAG TPA: hypothetical protein VFZ59_20830 [Verrucomicrobiae bacterium]|nr:hypothetical protein [Verrucomicrobiae bacterium]
MTFHQHQFKKLKRVTLQIVLLMLVIIAALPISGCNSGQTKKAAEAVITHHFRAVATNGFNTAILDYGTQFFQKTTKDEWSKALEGMSRKLGAYQSHTVNGWRVFTKVGSAGAGTTVSIRCQVTYPKHSATEIFTLFKGVSDSDYKIIRHDIDSTALLTE